MILLLKKITFKVGWVQCFDICNTAIRKIDVRFLRASNWETSHCKDITEVSSSKGSGQVRLCVHFLFPATNFIAIPFTKDFDLMNIVKERLKIRRDQLKANPLKYVSIVFKITTFWVVKLRNSKPRIASKAKAHEFLNEQETFLKSLLKHIQHLTQSYLLFTRNTKDK